MPYETHYVDSGRGVYKVGIGVVTGAQVLESAVQQSLDVERLKKLKYALIDFSQTTELQITSELVRQAVEIHRKTAQLTPGARVAIVAPSPLAYGMSRVWQSFSSDLGWTANVFHTRIDAVAWLVKQLGEGAPAGKVFELYPSLKIKE